MSKDNNSKFLPLFFLLLLLFAIAVLKGCIVKEPTTNPTSDTAPSEEPISAEEDIEETPSEPTPKDIIASGEGEVIIDEVYTQKYFKLAPLWERENTNGKRYSYLLSKLIPIYGQDMLRANPKDGESWCKGFTTKFSEQKKLEFYIHLISAMSKYESNFNTNAFYRENFRDSQGKYIISRGLLQVSIESVRGYGCNVANAQELHDPEINLKCSVMILNRWVGRDNEIATGASNRGGGRYWSVLRKGNIYNNIKAIVRAGCDSDTNI